MWSRLGIGDKICMRNRFSVFLYAFFVSRLQKFHFFFFFLRFFLTFSETLLFKELGFFVLHSVHQDASFGLSKTAVSSSEGTLIILDGSNFFFQVNYLFN